MLQATAEAAAGGDRINSCPVAVSPRRERIADTLGLITIALVLLDVLHPGLLVLPTIAAGGDTPCHYPTAAWFAERLLPAGRLHGWYPGAYLGHPLLLYYFPMPFAVMAALAPQVGLPVAFKLGTVLGVFLLPLLVYAAFRVLGWAFPTPLLGAAGAGVFLFVEDNPIWGGTLASTLTGEFSYTYGIGLAVLFLALALRAHERGRGPWVPGALLGLVAYAHGYAVLWAGITASALVVFSPRPWRTLRWLLAVAVVAFAFAAPLMVPLLADWGWTTPYDDAWITVSTTGLFPPLLLPLFAAGTVGLGLSLTARGGMRRDPRLALLAFGALAGAALASAGPAFGVIDVRFVPFAQLSFALVGAAAIGLALRPLVRRDLAALGVVLLALVGAEGTTRVVRSWADWNYSGLEAKELWPEWQALTDHLRGDVTDSRVAVEYGPVHEKAGSIRMYETLPFFSGRSTLEGVYNQASVMTHPVYYLASELFARSPNPFRSRHYSSFDPESGLSRLRLFNVGQIVAVSDELETALDGRDDVALETRIPPYAVYRLLDPGPGYAEPLAWEPVRAPLAGWRDAAYRWMTRKPANRVHLVFTGDERFALRQRDPWGPLDEKALPTDVRVESHLDDEEIRLTTNRPGHPILVKVSYHPRWRAAGALGPYLVSPGLMLVVPQQHEVRLWYAARTWADYVGAGLFVGAIVAGLAAWWRRRATARVAPPSFPPAGEGGARSRLAVRASRAAPFALLAVLAASRALPAAPPTITAEELAGRASRAYADEDWMAAAEYARHAADHLTSSESLWAEMLCVRGEALARASYPREAALAFGLVIGGAPDDPHRPQALYSGARAREESGDAAGAAEWRRWLRGEFPDNPWTDRLAADGETGGG